MKTYLIFAFCFFGISSFAAAKEDTLMPPVVVLTDTCPPAKTFSLKTAPPPKTTILPVVTRSLSGEDSERSRTAEATSQHAAGAGHFTTYTTDDGLALDAIACALTDTNGNLWFGTYGGGVSKYDGVSSLRSEQAFTNFTTAQGLANNVVFSIAEDKSGNLWFGTYGGGVSKYDGVLNLQILFNCIIVMVHKLILK